MVGVRGVMICQEENFPKQTFIILRGIINIGVLTSKQERSVHGDIRVRTKSKQY